MKTIGWMALGLALAGCGDDPLGVRKWQDDVALTYVQCLKLEADRLAIKMQDSADLVAMAALNECQSRNPYRSAYTRAQAMDFAVSEILKTRAEAKQATPEVKPAKATKPAGKAVPSPKPAPKT
jgi:hypothetical protein